MPKGVYLHRRTNPLDRFLPKVVVAPSGCWEWQASKIQNGYGEFWNGDVKMLAHRWAYERWVGPVPDGLELDHLCRNRACVNPSHLEPVPHSVNSKRGLAGKHRRDEAKVITHCPQGHLYDAENTWLRPNRHGGMSRNCRACQRQRLAAWREKNKEHLKQQRRTKYEQRKHQNR
jgi:hypothetical protein